MKLKIGFGSLARQRLCPPAPTTNRRQEAANQHQRYAENLGFSACRPRKVGHYAELSVKLIQPVLRRESLRCVDLGDIADVF